MNDRDDGSARALSEVLAALDCSDLAPEQRAANRHLCLRCHANFRELLQTARQTELTLAALQDFYARHKYLVMSRDMAAYHALGALLANDRRLPIAELAQRAFAQILRALTRPVSRSGDANALQHISGYLKKHLSVDDKIELATAIEQYRQGHANIDEPMALLKKHFARFPNPYIERQWFMQPLAASVE